MNNGLTESENALNCIIENYVNELQRNTCDDDEEDMRIYKEKTELIESQKEIVLKDLEILEILKKCEDEKHSLYCVYVLNALSSGKITQDDVIDVKEWLDGKD